MDAGGVMSGFAVALNAMDQTHVHALALRRMIFITMVPNNLRIARYVRIPYYIISTDYYILLYVIHSSSLFCFITFHKGILTMDDSKEVSKLGDAFCHHCLEMCPMV